MKNQTPVYNNGEIIVTFNSCKCTHAGKCREDISKLFRTSKLPWMNLKVSKTNLMINHVNKCPSGALKFDYLRN